MEYPWIIAKNTHGRVNCRDNSLIEMAKFAICGLCFFVHVVELLLQLKNLSFVVIKIITLASMNECNQNWMTLFTFHLHFQ
jgi:hypothetical protein